MNYAIDIAMLGDLADPRVPGDVQRAEETSADGTAGLKGQVWVCEIIHFQFEHGNGQTFQRVCALRDEEDQVVVKIADSSK